MHTDLPEHIASALFALARQGATYSEILQVGLGFGVAHEDMVVWLWNLIPQYRITIIRNADDYSGVPGSDLRRSLESYDQRDFESLSKEDRAIASVLVFDRYADNPPDSLEVEERCLLFKFYRDLPKWRYHKALLESEYESETISYLEEMILIAKHAKGKNKKKIFSWAEYADEWLQSNLKHTMRWIDLGISVETAKVLEKFGISNDLDSQTWIFKIIDDLRIDDFGSISIVFALASLYPKHIKTEADLKRRIQGFRNINADWAFHYGEDENRATDHIDSGIFNSDLARKVERLNIAFMLKYEHALRLSAKMDEHKYVYVDDFLKKYYGVEEID